MVDRSTVHSTYHSYKQNSGLDNVTTLMENLTVKLDASGFCDLEPLRFT